jgi:hypothetical protein
MALSVQDYGIMPKNADAMGINWHSAISHCKCHAKMPCHGMVKAQCHFGLQMPCQIAMPRQIYWHNAKTHGNAMPNCNAMACQWHNATMPFHTAKMPCQIAMPRQIYWHNAITHGNAMPNCNAMACQWHNATMPFHTAKMPCQI